MAEQRSFPGRWRTWRRPGKTITPVNRAGFSVMEALVVMLITGMALTLIFEVGVFSAKSSLRLGRRALAAADGEPGADSLRSLLRGIDFGGRPQVFDSVARGDSRGLVAQVNLDRPTLCADAGPFQRVQLRLQATPAGDLLTCSKNPLEDPVLIMDLRPGRGRFSYSNDGEHWRGDLRSTSGAPASSRLYVRLTTEDGRLDIAEEAATPRDAGQLP